MPLVTARRKCPDLIFVEPRFDVYKKVSQQIRAILAEHTAVIEPLSMRLRIFKASHPRQRARRTDQGENPRRDTTDGVRVSDSRAAGRGRTRTTRSSSS